MGEAAEGKSATLKLAAAVVASAAATAGAVIGARALARRNGGPVNPVLANAMTASEAAACAEAVSAPESADG